MALKLKNAYLNFNSDTLHDVRKEYNLDKPGAMDQVIDILQEWAQKQEHFTKKDFSGRYLETFIISSKGSVEKAKTKIDKICTARTIVPYLFEKCHWKNDFPGIRDFFLILPMPQLMEDNYRICILQARSKIFTPLACLEAMQQCMIVAEYLKIHDYVKGYCIIADLNDVNIMDIITNVNIVNFRNALYVLTEAYGFRLPKIYVISTSNVVNALVKFIKQFISRKIGERMNVVKTPECLYEDLPKKHLPADFGGEQKSVLELYDELTEEICLKKHVEHMKLMSEVRTIEELRCSKQCNSDSFGLSGTFKTLSID